jgi:hypothetical protein
MHAVKKLSRAFFESAWARGAVLCSGGGRDELVLKSWCLPRDRGVERPGLSRGSFVVMLASDAGQGEEVKSRPPCDTVLSQRLGRRFLGPVRWVEGCIY